MKTLWMMVFITFIITMANFSVAARARYVLPINRKLLGKNIKGTELSSSLMNTTPNKNIINYWKARFGSMDMPTGLQNLAFPMSLQSLEQTNNVNVLLHELCYSPYLVCNVSSNVDLSNTTSAGFPGYFRDYNLQPLKATLSDLESAGFPSYMRDYLTPLKATLSDSELAGFPSYMRDYYALANEHKQSTSMSLLMEEKMKLVEAVWFREKELINEHGVGSVLRKPAKIFTARATEWGPKKFLPLVILKALGGLKSEASDLLKNLKIQGDSPIATQIFKTMQVCKMSKELSLQGEIKKCLNSVEETIDFLKYIFNSEITKLSSFEMLESSSLDGQNEVVLKGEFKLSSLELKNDVGSKYVSCHSMNYPFKIDVCHYIPSTKIYLVSLESTIRKGYTIKNVVLCHTDTSKWSSDHIAFKALKAKPGDGTLCHFSEANAFSFVLHNQ